MFLKQFDTDIIKQWAVRSHSKNRDEVKAALHAPQLDLNHLAALLSPAACEHLEELANRSRAITLNRFGRAMQLYTPIYLSNYCHNRCVYCGFRAESAITRKIQSPEEVEAEALYLKNEGFNHLLLVAGDDDKHITTSYLIECIKRLHRFIPSISLEIAPQSLEKYIFLKEAGAEGVIIYQETYNKELYHLNHPTGNKSNYVFRLETPERVAKAGFHRVGLGALIGLGDPVFETLSLFSHAQFLMRHYWKTQITISLPRIKETEGSFTVPCPVKDTTFTQLICALRIALPDAGLVLSTRESPKLRDGLVKIGVTQMSAGSKTEPGGYLAPKKSGEQFSVTDVRSSGEVAKQLEQLGYDPVWKDWEGVLNDPI